MAEDPPLVAGYCVQLACQCDCRIQLSPVTLAEAAEPQPGPARSGHTQSAPVHCADFHTTQDARVTLQARAQQVQGGNLTTLLMAWFEAGYQTGRHEAMSQKQL